MAQKSDALKAEVDATRDDMTTKVAEIEARIKGSVDEQIESVKSALDVERAVQERPWVALGLAVVAGYAIGGLASSERTRRYGRMWRHELEQAAAGVEDVVAEVPDTLRAFRSAAERMPRRVPEPVMGAANVLADRLGDELGRLESAALTVVSDRLHAWLSKNLPLLADAYDSLGSPTARGDGRTARA